MSSSQSSTTTSPSSSSGRTSPVSAATTALATALSPRTIFPLEFTVFVSAAIFVLLVAIAIAYFVNWQMVQRCVRRHGGRYAVQFPGVGPVYDVRKLFGQTISI